MPASPSHDPASDSTPASLGGRLSRRGFFGLTGGLLVAAACGSDNSSGSGASTTLAGSGGGGSPGGLAPGIVSNDMYATERPQRFAFALSDANGFASGPPATITFTTGTTDTATTDAPLNSEGLPEGRGLYVVEAQFPDAGIFDAVIGVEGEELPAVYQILEEPEALTPDEAAPSVPSATVDDNRGVDPICTLDPPCPFHELNLADVTGAGRPVAIAFSTPARCTTRYCGPTLELLVELGPEFTDSLDIIHVEIFRDPTTNQVAEPVDAYGLISEPWMYAIDGAGTITNRMGGAWDKGELRTFLESAAG